MVISPLDNYAPLKGKLPFKVKVSFLPVIEYWQRLAESENEGKAHAAEAVLESIEHATELFEPFDDISILDKYEEEVRRLFDPLFPELLQENEIKGLSIPFQLFFFNATKRLDTILKRAGEECKVIIPNTNEDSMYIMAGIAILNSIYGVEIDHKRPFFVTIPDRKSGIDRYYRAFINADFVKLKATDRSPKLTPEDISRLVDNYDNVELWQELIPIESYDFEGFSLVTMFDVTVDESLSAMKDILLEQNSLHTSESLAQLEKLLRSYFLMGDLNLGVASYDREADRVRALKDHWTCDMIDDSMADVNECFCEESAMQVLQNQKSLIMSDIRGMENAESPLIRRLAKRGVASFIICPLEYDGETIGVLELTSKTPFALNSIVADKLNDIAPLYTIAMQREMGTRSTVLEAIIQEEFTSMHNSVSWKFHEVAERILANREAGRSEQVEEIVFEDVVPMYGQFDIRGSSNERNRAIQTDLIRQIDSAEAVLDKANSADKLPIYDHLKFRIDNWRSSLEQGMSAGDELKILDFLKTEIYPVFNHLKEQSRDLRKEVENYSAQINDNLGVIYDERKNYEESVTKINDAINEVIERHQDKAQEMFPHYFEKYKTDGIEYNGYIGQSLTPQRKYDNVYLKNLRLSQLYMAHAVEMRIAEIKSSLTHPMDIATLILVHNDPLAIRFRMDEMQFDVDGAYNIRYEIVKKRIDKAYIKGTTERLTQPGMLTVVYSQDEEAAEYRQYLEYLSSLNMIIGDIEDLELQDLQGTNGLRALRVKFQLEGEVPNTDAIEEMVNQMS